MSEKVFYACSASRMAAQIEFGAILSDQAVESLHDVHFLCRHLLDRKEIRAFTNSVKKSRDLTTAMASFAVWAAIQDVVISEYNRMSVPARVFDMFVMEPVKIDLDHTITQLIHRVCEAADKLMREPRTESSKLLKLYVSHENVMQDGDTVAILNSNVLNQADMLTVDDNPAFSQSWTHPSFLQQIQHHSCFVASSGCVDMDFVSAFACHSSMQSAPRPVIDIAELKSMATNSDVVEIKKEIHFPYLHSLQPYMFTNPINTTMTNNIQFCIEANNLFVVLLDIKDNTTTTVKLWQSMKQEPKCTVEKDILPFSMTLFDAANTAMNTDTTVSWTLSWKTDCVEIACQGQEVQKIAITTKTVFGVAMDHDVSQLIIKVTATYNNNIINDTNQRCDRHPASIPSPHPSLPQPEPEPEPQPELQPQPEPQPRPVLQPELQPQPQPQPGPELQPQLQPDDDDDDDLETIKREDETEKRLLQQGIPETDCFVIMCNDAQRRRVLDIPMDTESLLLAHQTKGIFRSPHGGRTYNFENKTVADDNYGLLYFHIGSSSAFPHQPRERLVRLHWFYYKSNETKKNVKQDKKDKQGPQGAWVRATVENHIEVLHRTFLMTSNLPGVGHHQFTINNEGKFQFFIDFTQQSFSDDNNVVMPLMLASSTFATDPAPPNNDPPYLLGTERHPRWYFGLVEGGYVQFNVNDMRRLEERYIFYKQYKGFNPSVQLSNGMAFFASKKFINNQGQHVALVRKPKDAGVISLASLPFATIKTKAIKALQNFNRRQPSRQHASRAATTARATPSRGGDGAGHSEWYWQCSEYVNKFSAATAQQIEGLFCEFMSTGKIHDHSQSNLGPRAHFSFTVDGFFVSIQFETDTDKIPLHRIE